LRVEQLARRNVSNRATLDEEKLRRAMPIYLQRTILELPRIYINGGARGFLVELDTHDAARVLVPVQVDVAVG